MKIYLATWLHEESQGKALTKMDKGERLLSYFHSKDKLNEFQCYCKTGKNKEEK